MEPQILFRVQLETVETVAPHPMLQADWHRRLQGTLTAETCPSANAVFQQPLPLHIFGEAQRQECSTDGKGRRGGMGGQPRTLATCSLLALGSIAMATMSCSIVTALSVASGIYTTKPELRRVGNSPLVGSEHPA